MCIVYHFNLLISLLSLERRKVRTFITIIPHAHIHTHTRMEQPEALTVFRRMQSRAIPSETTQDRRSYRVARMRVKPKQADTIVCPTPQIIAMIGDI
uniref:Putative secreted peptide n=1 Tax=Anopheles braziliensis TaxID=58242 RepID=A0A2M3ZSN6_9DIPT